MYEVLWWVGKGSAGGRVRKGSCGGGWVRRAALPHDGRLSGQAKTTRRWGGHKNASTQLLAGGFETVTMEGKQGRKKSPEAGNVSRLGPGENALAVGRTGSCVCSHLCISGPSIARLARQRPLPLIWVWLSCVCKQRLALHAGGLLHSVCCGLRGQLPPSPWLGCRIACCACCLPGGLDLRPRDQRDGGRLGCGGSHQGDAGGVGGIDFAVAVRINFGHACGPSLDEAASRTILAADCNAGLRGVGGGQPDNHVSHRPHAGRVGCGGAPLHNCRQHEGGCGIMGEDGAAWKEGRRRRRWCRRTCSWYINNCSCRQLCSLPPCQQAAGTAALGLGPHSRPRAFL